MPAIASESECVSEEGACVRIKRRKVGGAGLDYDAL